MVKHVSPSGRHGSGRRQSGRHRPGRHGSGWRRTGRHRSGRHGTGWPAAGGTGTAIATSRLVLRLLLRLIRQLIPTKVAVRHLRGCSGTAAVVAKRLSGLVSPSNRYRRYLGPPLSRRWPCSFLGFVGNDYGRRSSDTRFGHARLQFFTIEQRLKRLD